MSTDDRQLVADFARHRDEQSFRRLYRRHTPAMFAMAMRLGGARADAEELVQEAWCRAIERFDSFRHESALRTWLIGIVVNCHREALRRRASTQALTDDELPAATVTPLPVSTRSRAEPIDVERALRELPHGYREVVLLHDLNGYTHKEIAAMLGIQEGTSKSQLARGREHLRILLAAPAARPEQPGKRGET